MEEINAWGAYEAGTTQNARSLGSTVRHRRVSASPSIPPPTTTTSAETKSAHKLFFGTDDIATPAASKETDAEEEPSKKDVEEAATPEQAKEWTEIRNVALDVFRVYFGIDESNSSSSKKTGHKKRLYTKINGTMPSLHAYLSKLQLPEVIVNIILFVEASFRGIAQVYFQNSPLTGVLILAGMFVQSSRVAVHGIIAIIAGNLAGWAMGFDKSFLSCGLFGYNSFLVGLALATFYSPKTHEGYYWPVIVGAIVFAYFSSVLFVMLGKILAPYKTPPFTLPFNIATILFLLAMGGMNNVEMAPVRTPQLPSYESGDVSSLTAKAFFAGSIRGVGQVFLANNIVAGILVLLGIMVCSRISALAAFTGSAVGAGVAALLGCDRGAIENGMYGFNPSLTMTACLMFYVPSKGSISVGIIASIISVFIQLALATAMSTTGLPFMTLPFCLAALVFIVIQGTTSNVISVPLSSMTTPEDHLKRVTRLSNCFNLLYGAIRSSSYKGSANNRRSSWVPNYKKGTQRMNTILSDYDETVHGEKEKGVFARMLQCCKRGTDASLDASERAGGILRNGISFRMNHAMAESFGVSEEKQSLLRMFHYIDADNQYEITKDQFKVFLHSVGFTDENGLHFACEAFQLMDLDKSGDIDSDEFIAFAKISRCMPEIRRGVVKFFRFVDQNGDNSVEISELDSARIYLGLPPMSEKDHDSLVAFCNDTGELEFDVIVNLVTIFKLKSIVKEYQLKRAQGSTLDDSLDKSLHSSFKL